MSVDLLIVGAGLTGLFAANLALDQGLSVHLVANGRGGLSLSHGCIDLFHSTRPPQAIRSLPAYHPYQVVPKSSLNAALKAFKGILRDSCMDYQGGLSSSIPLVSALGTPYKTSLVPRTMIKGRLDDPRPITIAGLENYRDFWPEQLAANAQRNGIRVKSVRMLPLLHVDFQRDFYATDIANLLRDPSFRQELWRAWKPKLTREVRVGIPAILGLTDSLDILTEAEEIIGVDIFEIPSLPPSLPGLRLELTLINRLIQTGGEITEGPIARGRIDGRSKGRRTAGVQLDASGGIRSIDAKSLLLATGGFLHGGLKALQNGSVVESVFGIPVNVSFLKEQWSQPKPWEPQAYAQIGLRTDQHLRPQDQKGKAFLQNVFAAGGVLGGADRTYEGSRQGIDLVTAYHAIQSITALC